MVFHVQEDIESEDEGGVFMDLSNMKETRNLEVHGHCMIVYMYLNHMTISILCMYMYMGIRSSYTLKDISCV